MRGIPDDPGGAPPLASSPLSPDRRGAERGDDGGARTALGSTETETESRFTILYLFEAPSAAALDEAGRRAALPFERIVEAVEGSMGAAP